MINRNIYFYKVKAYSFSASPSATVATEVKLADIFSALETKTHKVSALNDSDNSIIKVFDDLSLIRIHRIDSDIICGTFGKIRYIRPKIINDTSIEELALVANTEIYEESHFVYFVSEDVLGMEFSIHAPRHRIIQDYLVKAANKFLVTLDEVSIAIMINPDTARKLAEMGNILEFEVSARASSVVAAGQTLITGLFPSAVNVPPNTVLTLSLKRGRARKNQPRSLGSQIRRQAEDLWRDEAGILESLKLVGESTAPGGGRIFLDFLQDKYIARLALRPSTSGYGIESRDMFFKTIEYSNQYVRS